MSRLHPTEPVRVRIGDCLCPGTPHAEGDFAWLRPRLTAKGGIAATSLIAGADDAQSLMRDLGYLFLLDGLVRWDILDDDGKPVPCNEDTLRSGALAWEETLLPIANAASELYTESVLAPFRPAKVPASSPSGQTDASTSASPAS